MVPAFVLFLAASPLDEALFRMALDKTPKPLRQLVLGKVTDVNAKHLADMLPLSRNDRLRAREALLAGAWEERDVLSASACEELVTWARPRLSLDLDSVDGAPSFQCDVPSNRIPDGIFDEPGRLSAFVRCYSAQTRPRLPFHVDTARRSASLNLSPSSDYDGGDLLLLVDQQVRRATRRQGAATVHDADIAHAISDVRNGERWALVVFSS